MNVRMKRNKVLEVLDKYSDIMECSEFPLHFLSLVKLGQATK